MSFFKKCICLLGLFFMVPGLLLAKETPTAELLAITINRNVPMDLDRVKALVAQGADVNGRGPGGVTPLVYAAESYAYLSSRGDENHLKSVREVIGYLMDQGADISAQDGRGVMGMLYLLNYGYPEKVMDVVKMYMDRVPNLGIPGHDDKIAPIHFLARTKDKFYGVLESVLKSPKVYQVNFAARSIQGYSLFHFAATRGKDSNGILRLQNIIDYLPAEITKALIDAPDETNSAPLVWAVLSNNIEAVKFLVARDDVDINRVSSEQETPLDMALRNGFKEVADVLLAAGGTQVVRLETINCRGANAAPMSFEKLQDILKYCQKKIKSLEDFLPLIPETMRSHYALVYASRALQKGSMENPRAIMMERNASIIMTFNGHKSLPGYDDIELMRKNPVTKRIELYNVSFKNAAQGKIQIEGPNPERCLKCHGDSPHPNWENWTFWPGVYFGDMMNLYPKDKPWYRKFESAQKTHPRYKYLLPISLQTLELPWGMSGFLVPGVSYNFSLALMDATVLAMHGEQLALEIANDKELKPYRYAILGALSCHQDVEDFIPEGHVLPFQKLKSEYVKQIKSEADEHEKMILQLQNSTPIKGYSGRYNVERFSTDTLSYYPELYKASGEMIRTPNLMWLLKGVKGPAAMKDWSQFFLPGNNHLFSALGYIEVHLWKELLDQNKDTDVWKIYETEAEKLKTTARTERIFSFLYKSAHEKEVCPLLKEKSLSILEQGPVKGL